MKIRIEMNNPDSPAIVEMVADKIEDFPKYNWAKHQRPHVKELLGLWADVQQEKLQETLDVEFEKGRWKKRPIVKIINE